VRHVSMIALMWALLLAWAGDTQAQAPRIAVFALNCFVPRTRGLHTRAALEGTITFAQRSVPFAARCVNGPSASLFPAVQGSDGPVQALAVVVVTSLEDEERQVVAQNRCQAGGRNGFLTFRCSASEAHGGEVEILVSIAPPPLEGTAEGALPE